MGFINRGRLNIRKRNKCPCARVSLSDVQPPEAHLRCGIYKLREVEHPIKKQVPLRPFKIWEAHLKYGIYKPREVEHPIKKLVRKAH